MGPFPGHDDVSLSPRKISTVALYGAFGSPILAAARSFRDAGIEPVVLNPEACSPRLWSKAVAFAACMRREDAGTPVGLAVITDFLEKTGAQALLAFWDPQIAWLASGKHSLPGFCRLIASSAESLQAVRSKREQLQIAQRAAFNVLPTWQLFNHRQMDSIDPAAYPVCVRPSDPETVAPTFKAVVLRSPSELGAFLCGRTWGPEPLLVQPFFSHPSVVIHGVRSEAGNLLALEAFVAPMKFEGVSLELRPLPLDEKIADCCRKFVEEVGITGPFHFDLLYSPETFDFYFLEINVRLGGTTDKVVRLGLNEPLLALAAFGFDVPVRPYKAPEGRSVVNRRFLLKHIGVVAAGGLSPLDYPVAGALHHELLSLRALIRDQDSVFSMRDLRGTWRFYLGGPRLTSTPRRFIPQRMLRAFHHQP